MGVAKTKLKTYASNFHSSILIRNDPLDGRTYTAQCARLPIHILLRSLNLQIIWLLFHLKMKKIKIKVIETIKSEKLTNAA